MFYVISPFLAPLVPSPAVSALPFSSLLLPAARKSVQPNPAQSALDAPLLLSPAGRGEREAG